MKNSEDAVFFCQDGANIEFSVSFLHFRC